MTAKTSSRDLILARVRDALGGAAATAEPPPQGYRRTGVLAEAAMIELLCRRIGDYRAEVRRVEAADLRTAIAAAFADHGAERVCIPPGIPAQWRPERPELIEDHGLDHHQLDALDGVLTGATLAIAQTGTIVLSGQPAEGRRALTLIPDLHICVIDEAQVVETLPQAIEALAATRRPVTFISGPSATSDIELRRVEGVHGPRRLVALVTRLGGA